VSQIYLTAFVVTVPLEQTTSVIHSEVQPLTRLIIDQTNIGHLINSTVLNRSDSLKYSLSAAPTIRAAEVGQPVEYATKF